MRLRAAVAACSLSVGACRGTDANPAPARTGTVQRQQPPSMDSAAGDVVKDSMKALAGSPSPDTVDQGDVPVAGRWITDANALSLVLIRLIQDRDERERLGRAVIAHSATLCDPAVQTRRPAALPDLPH